MMQRQRRATPEELAQGQKEMKEAQRCHERDMMSGELPEDGLVAKMAHGEGKEGKGTSHGSGHATPSIEPTESSTVTDSVDRTTEVKGPN